MALPKIFLPQDCRGLLSHDPTTAPDRALQRLAAVCAAWRSGAASPCAMLLPFDRNDPISRLNTISGVDRHGAQIIIAEIGVDMSRFPSADQSISWAGLAPGQNESAGKNRSSHTFKANRYLHPDLVQAAHVAGRPRNTYVEPLQPAA